MLNQDQKRWVADVKPEMVSRLKNTAANPMLETVDICRITNYSTFFAEWLVMKDDLVVHLFPRGGAEDGWNEGRYILRCRACDRERTTPKGPCECGHSGLKYVHGRLEEKHDISFPEDMRGIVEEAVHKVWGGTAAIESTKELMERTDNEIGAPVENDIGAYAVQFQKAWSGNPASSMYLLEHFFDAVDEGLERK
jgi:hypothetical protein